MKPSELRGQLRGVLSFVITPFRENHELDVNGLGTLVDSMCRSGVQVIVCTGGVAEFYLLSLAEYRKSIRSVVRAANGRVPILAGIG